MPRLLTVVTLIVFLSAGVARSDAQTQGPAPREVPTELWNEYPLKEPRRASPRGGADGEGAKRQARHRPAARPGDRETSDGGGDATPFLFAGLLLLGACALLAHAVRSGLIERPRRKERAPRRGVTAALLVADNQRAQHARGAHEPALAEPALSSADPSTAQDSRTPDSQHPRLATASMERSRLASDRDARAHPSLTRQPALGYASVPEDGDANGSMPRQQREIEETCGRKGLALLKVVRDLESRGGSDLNRPGLAYALERLEAHDASCLVVSSLERLTRSAADLGTLVEWLDRCGARLVVVDIDLDTGTPEGRLGAKALVSVGGSERKTIRQRTRKGLEAARLAQRSSGRPAVGDRPALKQRIAEMRASGMTLQAIADTLNAEGIPTLRGGIQWRPSSVQAATGYKRPSRKGRFA